MDNKLFVLTDRDSIGNQFLSELRDAVLQKDRMRFRRNMERLGEILAYEVSKRLPYQSKKIQTPLAESSIQMLKENPVLITILRAGIPFHQGFLNIFDRADSGFIGAYRNESVKEITVSIDYTSLPAVDGKHVVLIDPMLATGRSVINAEKLLLSKGTPAHVYIVSVVAAPEGLQLLTEHLAMPYSLWTCAVDEKLNSSFYIVPGLGDAGDLSYGTKD
jgi:uracil phosphoribosyltransferase